MSALDSEPEVIFAYTRQQALADGVLVDASDLAREAGFVFPVALTETLYHAFIVPALDLVAEGQSIQGRLWDLLIRPPLRDRQGPEHRHHPLQSPLLDGPRLYPCPYRTQGHLRPRRRGLPLHHGNAPR